MDAHAAPSARAEPSSAPRIAGRYRIDGRLARGGMGEVYVAFDEATGSEVALKRLRADALKREPQFRAEYHALAQLRHPRIIRVFDYGVDGGIPYYTMELLRGRDLRDLEQLSCAEACRYLRDVASSLALLHARRWIHRDLSPRNVRILSDGHCKLIDFGTMVPFGRPSTIAGTAPYVPPEAVYGSQLDQRSDLYSLGALAYWLLSGTDAVPVKSFDELPRALEVRPVPLRELRADLPAGLDELVMSLLEHNPVNRPATAAEVIARLTAMAQLEPDDAVVAPSYIVSGALVGRAAQLATITTALDEALAGKGSAHCIQGAAGTGKTRLLSEAVVLAQTRGLLSIAVQGGGERVGGTLVSELLTALRRVAPDAVADWPTRVSLLDATSDARDATLGFESRARAYEAFRELLVSLCSQRPLVLAIDDLDEADEFSASLLSALARELERMPLVILATAGSEAVASSLVLHSFVAAAPVLAIDNLDRAAVSELAQSLFSAAPNAELLADWLFRGASGNPWLTMELLRHLVERSVVRYFEGAWVLPADEIHEPLPPSLRDGLAQRLVRLPNGARELLEVLALSLRPLTLELLLGASEFLPEAVFSSLSLLVHEGLLTSASGGYAFAQSALRATVRDKLEPARERRLHGRLGATLLSADQEPETQLTAGFHLVHSDDELRGAELLARVGPVLFEQGRALGTTIPALERALSVFERHGVSLARRLRLSTLLVRAGYAVDYRLAQRYGESTLDTLHRSAGLDVADRLRPRIGVTLALWVALFVSTYRFLTARTRERPLWFYEALMCLSRVAGTLVGVRCAAMDAKGARSVVERLPCLGGLPASSGAPAVLHAANAWALQAEGREGDLAVALEQAERSVAAVSPRAITPAERRDISVGLLLSAGLNECYRIGGKAFERADALEREGSELARAAAQRIRMTYHSVRGEAQRTEHHRKQLELYAIAGATTWQLQWFAAPIEAMSGTLFGDLVTARRGLERLEELVRDAPSLASIRDMVRFSFIYRRGDHAEAVRLGELWRQQTPPHSRIGWGTGYAALAYALNAGGHHERARELCESALSTLSERDREYGIMYTSIEGALAVACAGLGERERAHEIVERNLSLLRAANESSMLAMFHETKVLIGRLTRDAEATERALADMRAAAAAAGSPQILAFTERLSHSVRPGERKSRETFSSRPPNAEGEGGDVVTAFARGRQRQTSDRPLPSSSHDGDDEPGHSGTRPA